MIKKDIRKIYAEKRRSLSGDVLKQLSARMASLFEQIVLGSVKSVLSYSPMHHRNEFDVRLCEAVLATRQGVTIAHPRMVPDSVFMEAVVTAGNTRYARNAHDIREPVHGNILTPESFDLVLIPLLAFDVRGYRVGYGKGFYDRWLAQCRPETIKAGFSFFEPLEAIDDINEFDVPLNLCVTPMRVYEF